LPNPGREDRYKTKTGKDQEVIDFLEQELSVKTFNENVFSIVDQSVTTYINRGFAHLMVSFGCTGGQHRSVYCAEYLAKRLEGNQRVKIELHHLEQEEKAKQ
jgi:RNase adaptor protein for sRNA GlmZ degradation